MTIFKQDINGRLPTVHFRRKEGKKMTQEEREKLIERILEIMAELRDEDLVILLWMARALLKP